VKTVLITGFTGMLGRELTKHFLSQAIDVYGISRHYSNLLPKEKQMNLNLADLQFEYLISTNFKPDLVIHAAAITDLKYCSLNPLETTQLHVFSSGLLAKRFKNAKFIYISTDSVFDGQKGNYTEKDAVKPLNIYASTKKDGEDQVLNENENSFILRTNIIGFHDPIKSSLFEWAYKTLKEGTQINGFSNVFFNPLYCGSYGKLITEFLNQAPPSGIYNFASSDRISKFDFLVKAAEKMNLDESLIVPVEMQSGSDGVIRPLNTTLNIEKSSNLGVIFPSMIENIQHMCDDFKPLNFSYGI
jgi:dTDP-4-dehydrorhamnose reductase